MLAFLSVDIPLKKLRNAEMRELFTFMGQTPPSESAVNPEYLEWPTQSSKEW